MLTAIQLNNELELGAGEVCDSSADRMLSSKFPFGEAFAQCAP